VSSPGPLGPHLSADRRVLAERLLREEGLTADPGWAIEPCHQPGPHPPSFAQERLWFLHQLSPGNPFYNMQASIRYRGKLDHEALERAVNALVGRHDVLRTVFQLVDGRPMQVVRANLAIPLAQADLRNLPAAEREPEAARIAVEERQRPYDLAVGPLLRAKVICLGNYDYLFFLSLHHIVADGWSMGVLSGELGVLYEGLTGGREVVLPDLPVQYADFAVWQRGWLAGDRLAGQLEFWRGVLAGLPVLTLPTDRPRPAVQAHRGMGFGFVVPEPVVGGLGRLSRESGATLFMVLLAAFAVVLGRWCGQDDVVVGAPIAGRNRAELEGLIGFFVNTLVLRVDLSGDPSFADLVGRVREVALGAYAHADVPFEKLVEELVPQRDLSRNPLFQVTFQLFESPSSPDVVGAHPGFEVPVTSSLFDVRVDLSPGPAGLAGRVEFDTDLFDRASIEWMVDRFCGLLVQVAGDPGRRVGSYGLLPAGQRELVAGWNATGVPVPGGCLHGVVQDRAARHAAAVAVSDESGQWSYGELNALANRLAWRLAGAGVGVGELAGVYLPRGRWFVAAALAVLKAGGGYVPLDPAYPAGRLEHVVADAAPRVVVTTGELAGRLRVPEGTEIVTLDEWPAGPEADLEVAVQPSDVAYVIYTSGSTGTPKGVVIEHHSVMNLVAWHNRAYQVTPADRGSQLASTGFDAAVWEIWPYLCAGASVHVASDDTRADPDQLTGWLDASQITISFVPTPLAETLLDRPWPPSSRLRLLLTGGDTLRGWPNPAHPYQLINHYGPTESTVVTTAGPVPPATTGPAPPAGVGPAPPATAGRLPGIGAPIANTVCYVVDHHGSPAGPGCPGELWIGGTGLARGYLHDTELTQARFVTNPFDPTPPRLYRTGDLVRWQPDGTLTYLGRTDNQIKIRGYRIEPGEIETLLRQHPDITQAIVTTHPHPTTGTPQLTAYITTRHHPTDTNQQVAAWRSLYQETYAGDGAEEPEFDIRGWNSSYDGLPLGPDAMGEQVDQTVDRILALHPRRVLEVGTGTGLLLFRLANACERYCATDFSAAALARVARRVAELGWDQVELRELEACELAGLSPAGFDVVILNSVVQYFPGADYLEMVLDGALGCLSPGGAIFIGDIRNHALMEAFHASVELHRAEPGVSVGDLRRRIRNRVITEQELLVDPAWFTRFASERAMISQTAAWPRRGRCVNELTRFRYDVTLATDAAAAPPLAGPWLDWDGDQLDLAGVARRIDDAERPVGVRGIPSARLEPGLRAQQELASAAGDLSVGALRDRLDTGQHGVDPEDLWRLPVRGHIELGWHASGDTGRYDLVAVPVGQQVPPMTPPLAAGRRLTNDPLSHSNGRRDEVREWLQHRLPEQMIPAAIVPIASVPLTVHGKVDLGALPTPEPAVAPAGETQPVTEIEERLGRIWAQTLGLEDVGPDDNFFGLGGDSILSIKLTSRAADAGMYFSTKQLFQKQTVRELARVVSFTPRLEAELGPVTGEVLLTPIQRWFFDQDLANPHHFNQAAALPVPKTVDIRLLIRALREVIKHHDALHLRFTRTNGQWRQHCDLPNEDLTVASADLSVVEPGAVGATLERAGGQLQTSLSLSGPLVRVGLFNLGAARPWCLLIIIHHLAVDAVSWRILVEDLWSAYQQLAEGLPISLPAKTTSFRTWSQRLTAYAARLEVADEAGLWLAQLPAAAPRLPRDLSGQDNSVGACRSVRVKLTGDETDDLVRRLLAEQHVEINEVLLSALARVLQRWTGRDEIHVVVEGHGREPLFDELDLSRTVGWFTSVFPLTLRLPAKAGPAASLAAVAEQLRAIPQHGIGYGLLRYLSADRELGARLATATWPEVAFNYFGQIDKGATDALSERTGPVRSPAGRRPYLLEVNGAVTGGRLQFDFYYGSAIHHLSTIRGISDGFIAELRSLLEIEPLLRAGDGLGDGRISARDIETVLASLSDDGDLAR
jgi:amino acid adenylation domain-containing protein/non-ribosomal peptide synthase protein (TIGR01720 family)